MADHFTAFESENEIQMKKQKKTEEWNAVLLKDQISSKCKQF